MLTVVTASGGLMSGIAAGRTGKAPICILRLPKPLKIQAFIEIIYNKTLATVGFIC